MEMISSQTDWQTIHTTLQHLNLIGITFTPDFIIRSISAHTLMKTGWEEAELVGKSLFDNLVPKEEEFEVRQMLEEGIQGKRKLERREIPFLARKGTVRTFSINSVLLHQDENDVSCVTLIGDDITRRRRMESSIAKSNSQLQDLVDNTSDLIQLVAIDGKFIFVNKAWREVLGFGLEEIASMRMEDILHPQHVDEALKQLESIRQGNSNPNFEAVFQNREGKKVFVKGSVNCRFDGGKPTAFRCILNDYTEKIRAEKAQNLYYSIANWTLNSPSLDDFYHSIHEELGKIIDVKNFFIALYDPSQSYLYFPYYVDQYFKGNVRFTRRRLGNGVTEYAIASNKPLFLSDKDIEELAKTNSLYLYGVTPKLLLCVPLRIGDRVTGIIGVKSYDDPNMFDARDLELLEFISGQVALAIARKQSEQELSRYVARLNAIFDSSSHLIWSVNKSLQLTSFNKNYADLIQTQIGVRPSLQVTPEKFGWRMVGNANRRILESKYRQALRGEPQYFEFKIDKQDGGEMWLEFYLNPIHYAEGLIEEVSGIARDITRRKEAELSLRHSEELFRGIFENLQDIYCRIDRHGRITMISQSVLKRLGYLPEEVIGKELTNFFSDKKRIHSALIRLRKTRSLRNFEITMPRKDGSERQFMINMLMFVNDKGKPTEVAALARDITELKRNELELLKAKEHAERSLKVKEGFLANMSHEIRTPMNGVIGMIDLLGETKLNEEQRDYVLTIKRSSETLLNILNDILDLSKIEAGKMVLHEAAISVEELLLKLVSLFGQTAKSKGNTLTYHIAPDIPRFIIADQTRLLQILSNLTSNALKFTEKGSVKILLNLVEQRDNIFKIKVDVQDSGIGISAMDRQILFTSFTQLDNSSKKSFGGTGLGLAISKQLCALMNGSIGVESTLGEGSTFWFTFETRQTTTAEVSMVGPGEEMQIENVFTTVHPHILLVDDNAVNRKVANEILKKSGCTVDLADSGFVAIEKVEKMQLDGDQMYDIIFMDIQMPDMDGVQTTQELRKRVAGLPPVVAMTAYSMKEDRDRFISQGMDDYIAKPIRAQHLVYKVKELIGNKLAVKTERKAHEVVEEVTLPVLDKEIIDQLKGIGGPDLVLSVFEDFVQESTGLIDEALAAFEKGDIPTVKSNLHTLKGSAGTVGVSQVAEIARDAEWRLKSDDTSTLAQALPELKRAYEKFLGQYEESLAEWMK
ncbi:Sensor histidine kinase RcsC [Dyadobacter sp. CECT 9275]|uniref:Sensory/regulatory protein RpfC n=1 Tax=Dyadobacter helix TaxID=2822344 RepID=A0A916JBU2_9BACT|nr:PAS domain S-box protein [Dyadobacter sp. CECT 9275]CAG5002877.1 Sensor histidine kinase RcsC [Dyadobacter sp. CECT 9275]